MNASNDLEKIDQTIKINQSQEDSMNFDDNYDEEEFMKQQNGSRKVEKLTIMDDFEQISQKLKSQTNDQPPKGLSLDQYYAKLKAQKAQQKNELKKSPGDSKLNQTLPLRNNKPSPVISQHMRSGSDNNSQSQPISSSQMSSFQDRSSYAQSQRRKINKEADGLDCKKNYSSVEEKKKILQPSKNSSNLPHNILPAKGEYFGDADTINDFTNFVNKKVHGKDFISKEAKTQKEYQTKKSIGSKKQFSGQTVINQKSNKQNSLKQSNFVKTSKRYDTVENQKESKMTVRDQKPRVILFKKCIDLTVDPNQLLAQFKSLQIKSDYEIPSQSQSLIEEEGLFQNALEIQRNSKTVQNVQSPMGFNHFQPFYKEPKEYEKHYIPQINIRQSPNPTNTQKTLFPKKQAHYR